MHLFSKMGGLWAFLLAVSMALAPLRADQAFACKAVTVKPDGVFTIGGLDFAVVVSDPSWSSVEQGDFPADANFPQDTPASFATQVTFHPKTGDPIQLGEKMDKIDDSSFKLSYHADGVNGNPFKVENLIAVEVHLPAASFAGKSVMVDDDAVALPVTVGQNSLNDKWGATKVTFPVDGGTVTIEGDLKVHIQDDRFYDKDFFLFWLVIAKSDAPPAPVNLDLTIGFHPDAPAGK
jgi:hypothetical protein